MGLRFAASRCRWLTNSQTTNKQVLARYGVQAFVPITSLQVWVQNSRNSPVDVLNDFNGEFGLGAPATANVSIEWPVGQFTRTKFNGTDTAIIPDIQLLGSDFVNVNIPAGAIFWVWQFWQNANGIFYNAWQDLATFGDKTQIAVSGLTDQTLTGVITDNSGFSFPPAAIVANHELQSIGIVGDSIGYGNRDDPAPYLGGTGTIAKSLVGKVAFQNLSCCGQCANTLVASNRSWFTSGLPRRQLLPFCTNLICELGINDIDGASGVARTSVELQSDINNLMASIRQIAPQASKIFVQTTLTPHSTSTDGWTSIGNQTPSTQAPGEQSERQAFNTAVRTGTFNKRNFIEIANFFESSFNSDLWQVLGYVLPNIVIQSNGFSNAIWIKILCTVAQGGFADPFGGTNAWKQIEDTSNGVHFKSQALPKIGGAGTYTYTVYCKYGANRRLSMRLADGGGANAAYAVFDLQGHQVATSATVGTGWVINAVSLDTDQFATGVAGNGWYRARLTATTANADTTLQCFTVPDNGVGTAPLSQSYTGDGTSFIFLFGEQVENASVPSVYVPTAGPTAATNDGLHPTTAGYNSIVGLLDFSPLWGAKYRFLENHQIGQNFYPAGTSDSDTISGGSLPMGWLPTPNVDPLNDAGVIAFYNAGPQLPGMIRSRFQPEPVLPPATQWVQLSPGQWSLSGLGANANFYPSVPHPPMENFPQWE